jgi:hypothetical protein
MMARLEQNSSMLSRIIYFSPVKGVFWYGLNGEGLPEK